MRAIVLDACLPYQIVEALKLFKESNVFHLREKFQDGAQAEYFIPYLARDSCVLLTKDLAMGRGIGMSGKLSPQAKVLRAYKGMALFLPPKFGNYRTLEQAWRIFKYWSTIRETAEAMQPGQIYDVQENGDCVLRT